MRHAVTQTPSGTAGGKNSEVIILMIIIFSDTLKITSAMNRNPRVIIHAAIDEVNKSI